MHLYISIDPRVYRRNVNALDPPSATREAISVMIRSTLKTIAEGERLDWEEAPEPPPPPPVVETAPPPPPSPPGPTWRWSLSSQFVADGLGFHPNLGGHVGRYLGPVGWIGLELFGGLPQTETDPDAIFDVTRHAGRLNTAWRAVRFAPQWALELGGSAGVALYRRTTQTTDPNAEATPAGWTVAATLGLDTRLSYAFFDGWALEFTVGAEAVLGRPVFQVETDVSTRDRSSTWPITPRVGLALVFFSG